MRRYVRIQTNTASLSNRTKLGLPIIIFVLVSYFEFEPRFYPPRGREDSFTIDSELGIAKMLANFMLEVKLIRTGQSDYEL